MGARRDDTPADLKDAGRGERLQRVLARAGVGSRRACEALIEAGEVEVNGEVVRDLPAWVDAERDRIVVEGRPLRKEERHVHVMLYKPKNYVTTTDDEAGRRTVLDLVEHPSGVRLYPVGRLDYDTMGLLLMTNDGELANRLTHPRYGMHKKYRAIVKGRMEDEQIEELERGVYMAVRREGQTVGAERTGESDIRIVRRDADRTILDVTLAEGRNRQVRRMLANVGFPVKKLTRIEMGPLKLKKLRVGEWRELSSGELAALRRACGMTRGRKAKQARGKGGAAWRL